MGLQLEGGRDYKRQFTVCDWPGFEIWNHGKWQVRSGKLKGFMGLVFWINKCAWNGNIKHNKADDYQNFAGFEFGLPVLLKRKTGNGQSSPWDMWISPKIFLDQLNTWINVKRVSGEVRKFLLSVVTEILTVANTIFCMFCFEAVASGLDDVSNNRLKLNLRMSQELDSFIYNF